ncbi:hypothetical protein [Limibacterium fermenti]|jgi:hypothetical protein|uniref:hypothetical protein n=1 Tax=Limibacterium fermenti TaxID=3229863 RepID=UPI003A5D98D1
MITTLKQGESKIKMRQLIEALAKNRKPKHIDVHSYCGKIKLKEDPLSIQRKMRDEWD